MTIAPLDHLWVRGSVSELDADQVEVDQKLHIIFPFSNRAVDARVDYIDKAIDIDSRSAKFRTAIANPEPRFKAGMFVRMLLEIPPKSGQTLIPRIAMVSVDRYEYVFVKKPGKGHRFERRQLVVVKESNDVVIVAEPSARNAGLTPGEEVVTTGSLILEQMYEDRVMTEGGLAAAGPEEDPTNTLSRSSPVVISSPANSH
jgi:cobalt-zinc-cadmium efflux system membrane fusion protein